MRRSTTLLVAMSLLMTLGAALVAPTAAAASCVGWSSGGNCLGARLESISDLRGTCVGSYQGDHCTGVQV